MSELTTNDMQREVDPRCHSRAREHAPIFHEDAVRVNASVRLDAAQFFDMIVMSGAFAPAQQPGVAGDYAACTHAHERERLVLP